MDEPTKALVRSDFGNGSKRYTDETLRKYIQRIRWNAAHYYRVAAELERLESRYQKILESRRNQKA